MRLNILACLFPGFSTYNSDASALFSQLFSFSGFCTSDLTNDSLGGELSWAPRVSEYFLSISYSRISSGQVQEDTSM